MPYMMVARFGRVNRSGELLFVVDTVVVCPAWRSADPATARTTTDLNLRHVTVCAAREPTTLISISSVNKQSAPAANDVAYTSHSQPKTVVFFVCVFFS